MITFTGGKYYLSENEPNFLFSKYSYWCPICKKKEELSSCMYWVDKKTLEIHGSGWCSYHGLVDIEWETVKAG